MRVYSNAPGEVNFICKAHRALTKIVDTCLGAVPGKVVQVAS